MEIIQIVALGLVSTFLAVILKQSNRNEFSMLISIITGVIILGFVIDKLRIVINVLNQIITRSSVETGYFSIIIKIVAISYIIEFASQIARDSKEDAIASKIELGGKAIIMIISLPILLGLLDLLLKIIP